MHYLAQILNGKAAQVITGLTMAQDSLDIALGLLTERYESRRLITMAHLDALLKAPPMKANSVSELNGVVNSVTVAVNSLKALDL